VSTPRYEGLIVLPPGLSEQEVAQVGEDIKKFITENSGTVQNTQDLGKRPFSYPIKKRTEGYYLLIDFELAPDKLAVLSRALRLNTKVYRQLITKKVSENQAHALLASVPPASVGASGTGALDKLNSDSSKKLRRE
jgi:small subunit ribosomal protein S6